ncbi:hypothetical protein EGH90_02235 [Kaistella haifensis]|nr:hypothetical protein EGH90_02235 [Kaistella haifensis]
MKLKLPTSVPAILLCAIFLTISCGEKPNLMNENFKEKLIDKKLMTELDNTYASNNYLIINSARGDGSKDSREYWYSIEDLEGYIAFVKKEAALKNHKVLGMKIKMGQYPINGKFDPRLNPKYYGYQAVYLVPTGELIEAMVPDAVQNKAQDSLSRLQEISGIPGMDLSLTHPPY